MAFSKQPSSQNNDASRGEPGEPGEWGEPGGGLFSGDVDPDEMMDDDEALPVVTSLRGLKRDPMRVSIYVGKRFIGKLRREDASDLGIHVGAPWTSELEQQTIEWADLDRARVFAQRSLGRRSQSRGELIFRLKRRGFSETVGERIAEEYARVGYLDDEAYGQSVLRELMRTRPAGARLMRQRLAAKRLDRALIDRLVSEALADSDQGEAIDRLVERKLRGMSCLDRETKYRRLIGLLARRGFDHETIRETVGRHLEAGANQENID